MTETNFPRFLTDVTKDDAEPRFRLHCACTCDNAVEISLDEHGIMMFEVETTSGLQSFWKRVKVALTVLFRGEIKMYQEIVIDESNRRSLILALDDLENLNKP